MKERIHIKSGDVDLSDTLVAYARRLIVETTDKYFGNLQKAEVHFGKEGEFFVCSVNIKSGGLRVRSAEALDRNAYVAFKAALEKVATQLRRLKRELREDKPIRLDRGILTPRHAGSKQAAE